MSLTPDAMTARLQKLKRDGETTSATLALHGARLDGLELRYGDIEQADVLIAQQRDALARLESDTENVRARIVKLSGFVTNEQLAAFTTELERIQGVATSGWTDLNDQLTELKSRVDDHDRRIGLTETRLANHGERLESVECISNANASAVAQVRAHLGLVDEVPHFGVAFVAALFGLAAFLAAFLWLSLHDWTHTSPVKDLKGKVIGHNIDTNVWGSSVWLQLVIGVLIALAVYGLLYHIISSHNQRRAMYVVAGASAAASAGTGSPRPTSPSVTSPASPSTPTDPTAVLPAVAPSNTPASANAAATANQ